MSSDMRTAGSRLTVERPELLEDGTDTRFRDLLHSIFAFSSRLQVARTRFGAHIGLSPTQYMVLIAISRLASENAGIAQIANWLYFSGAFVTIEVNKLVKLGLAEKAPHPVDRRRVVLRPSAEGERRLAALAAFQRPVNDALFKSLKKDEFLTLHRLMAGLVADADAALSLAEYVEDQLKAPAKAG
ncbi:MarR family winged helix-turn-helix transcriptional regulator [Methylocella sp. CPCC 101449]|uniref:MarR family winged helix-turn-helix transcriptional regulator n=1 Tax=Methylocella sp. CPCC 101449 TaxID=2987531 RepID=UPI00288DBDC1|nr:MarR family winged helix-turn-helix transcriptional regulator [Methylocella sp. CPCC 101449]MDT2020259.1 MarR family winged helix-turn-helix transcriptional regulator [Methylocella sp. CPCC 101449]HEV2574801.1 MarR family winged helix-turn-helix transcriptional regulator [Beijerinckiaceae bacterium]